MYDRRLLYAKSAWRIAKWWSIAKRGATALHQPPDLPFKMYLEPKFHSVGSLSLYALGARYELGLLVLPKLLESGDVAIDCGANQGGYALYAAHLVGPTGRVVAVEPQPYAARAVRISAAANDFANLEVLEAAVGKENGMAAFYIGDSAVSASLIEDGQDREIEVRACRIDDILAERGLSRLDFIKLDVEGAEADALEGAAGALADHRPIVLWECWDASSLNSRRAWDILRGHGYRMYDIAAGDRLEPLEAPAHSFNLLAAPPEREARISRFGIRASAAPAPRGAGRSGAADPRRT